MPHDVAGQVQRHAQPLLPGAWLLKLPGPGSEARFSRWFVNANFTQDVLVLVLELLLVTSFVHLRLVQQLACPHGTAPIAGASQAAGAMMAEGVHATPTTPAAAGVGWEAPAHGTIPATGQAGAAAMLRKSAADPLAKQQCIAGLALGCQDAPLPSSQAAVHQSTGCAGGAADRRTASAVQQDFHAWLGARLAAPDTRPLYRWLLQQLQEALWAFPCDGAAGGRYSLQHTPPAGVDTDITNSNSSSSSSSSSKGHQGTDTPQGGPGGSSSSSGPHQAWSSASGRRAAAARARSLWRMQLTWVLKHLYQVSYITQAYAQDWSFILWSAGLHINLLGRLLGMRLYLRHPWLRTLLVAVTRLGMMLGHLVTLHLLRAERLPALQLTTTMYFTAGRQRLGLMYAVWKAAGIAKVPCKHQLWLGIVEYVVVVAVMAQTDVATHGQVLLRSCGVGAAWLLVYAVPLVLVLRTEGQARVQMLMQQR